MGLSAIGRGTAVEEQKVKASSGDATPGFLDGKVDADTMTVVANQLVSVNEFFVGTFSRDMTLATGTQAVAGVGFSPKSVVFIGVRDNFAEASWGVDTLTGSEGVFDANGISANTYGATGSSIHIVNTAGLNYAGVISSFDVGGFTISWTRTGAKAGLATIKFLAFK